MIGFCKLCHREGELCKSHVIPEWAYKSIYDEKHQYFVFQGGEEVGRKPRGVYERLLCRNCEERTGVWDNYARHVIFATPETNHFNLSCSGKGQSVFVHGLDYDKFKLFQLSILLRASVSSRAEFNGVSLGPYEDEIRLMLRNGDPGEPAKFGCATFGILFPSAKLATEVMQPPFRLRQEKHILYQFVFGGCGWMFVISRNYTNFPFQRFFANRSGNLEMPVVPADQTGILKSFAKTLGVWSSK